MAGNTKILWVPLVFLALLYASNQHLSWSDGIEYLHTSDVSTAYIPITQSAPSLPTKALILHHAQRFFWPYTIGVLAKVTAIPYEFYFYFFAVVLILAICFSFFRFLLFLRLGDGKFFLVLCLLIFNPYSFRYYLIVPAMIGDLGCVLFTSLALFALCKKNHWAFLLCLLFSLLSRQSILIQLPLFLLWILFAEKEPVSVKVRKLLLTLVVALGGYFAITQIASRFSYASQNLETVTAIFSYVRQPNASRRNIAELIIRSLFPILIPFVWTSLSLWNKRKNWKLIPKEFYLCFFSALAVISQPILAGPLTGKNASRLGALGLVPMLMALAYLHKDSGRRISRKMQLFFASLIFLGSFHHLYSQPRLPNVEFFVDLQIFVMIICSVIFWRVAFPPRNSAL